MMQVTDLNWKLMESIRDRADGEFTAFVEDNTGDNATCITRSVIHKYLTCDGEHGGGRCGDPNCWTADVHPYADSVKITDDVLQRLRKLRLWHWKQSQNWRALQLKAMENSELLPRGDWNKIARQRAGYAHEHLGAVQLLNEFFPIGDTAERDEAREVNHE